MNKEYIASEYRRMHKDKKFNGDTFKLYIPGIRALIKKYNCKTVLDYGCGKAKMHPKDLAETVTLYDPYYEPYSKKPSGTYDMVICTDVLEHIPTDDIRETICELIRYTNKVLFLTICTKPAKKKFKNGENVHLTVKPESWWEEMFADSLETDIDIVRIYT